MVVEMSEYIHKSRAVDRILCHISPVCIFPLFMVLSWQRLVSKLYLLCPHYCNCFQFLISSSELRNVYFSFGLILLA